MKLYKCCECEKSFESESEKPLCNNKFRNGQICGSDDVRELKEINRYSNEVYTNRLFREGQSSY